MLHSLLIVDDEQNVISALKRIFFNEDFEIYTANSGAEGLDMLSRHPIQVVISDEKMPGMSGSEFLSEVAKRHPKVIKFMLTGQASIETAMRAINEGEIYRFFTKPWDDIQLTFAIKSAFEKFDLEEENRRLLQTVRRQAVEMKSLEKLFPGISDVCRDDDGNIVIDNLSSEEIEEVIRSCERECLKIESDRQ